MGEAAVAGGVAAAMERWRRRWCLPGRLTAAEEASGGESGWVSRSMRAATSGHPGSCRVRSEFVVGCDIRRHSHLGEALEHDQRVVRAAAQRLSASEQKHQRRILRRTGLYRPPRQVVKGFVVAAIGRRERQLAAVVPLGAAEVSGWLELGR